MRMSKLAFLNFKSSAKNFLSLILSLAFTIMIFLNFVNIIFSDTLVQLGERNKNYSDIIVQVLCFIIGVFSFFYIWYATNVFLTKRKKEIGIYIFMGLSNDKIGKMYMIESALIGVSSLVLGLFFGVLTIGLFQMILLAVAGMAVDITFQMSLKPIMITGIVYVIIYSVFVWKGYFNIAKSSVLEMISAARQNEYVRQNPIILLLKSVLGCGVLGMGFYMSVKESGGDYVADMLAAVVLVTVGIYLVFGGLLPFIFQKLAKNKNFLYQKQRNLWVNQMIFRMKKNYRTYAMVSVLALSGVTALAASFAVKSWYDNKMWCERIYTFQFLTNQENLGQEAEAVISENSSISYQSQIPGVMLEVKEGDSGWGYSGYLMVPYSGLKELAAAAGLEFKLEELAENEIIGLENLPLMSFIGYDEKREEKIVSGHSYERVRVTREPYLGYLQNIGGVCIYAVNDMEYERLLAEGQATYIFNYRISDPEDFIKTKDALSVLVSENNEGERYAGRIAVDPRDNDLEWVKVLYALCGFVFMVFIIAGGCIMLMKIYNDSTEEKERYRIMKKMGFSTGTLRKSIAWELAAPYGSSFFVMAISSYFSVNALAKAMHTNLISVNIVSVLIIFVIFAIFYLLSVSAYWRNAGVGDGD